jgi:hypothetical protein
MVCEFNPNFFSGFSDGGIPKVRIIAMSTPARQGDMTRPGIAIHLGSADEKQVQIVSGRYQQQRHGRLGCEGLLNPIGLALAQTLAQLLKRDSSHRPEQT